MSELYTSSIFISSNEQITSNIVSVYYYIENKNTGYCEEIGGVHKLFRAGEIVEGEWFTPYVCWTREERVIKNKPDYFCKLKFSESIKSTKINDVRLTLSDRFRMVFKVRSIQDANLILLIDEENIVNEIRNI